MSGSLKGSVALVTGASSGIGEATARSLASRGAKVALVARRLERLEKLAKELAGEGHTALAIEADITDQGQAIHAVERAVGDFGRLDVLINNAGVMLLGPVPGAPVEEWDRMIDINLKGLLYMTHAALPHLISAAGEPSGAGESSEDGNGGRGVTDVVNISSVAGRVASAGSGVYNMTKFGVGAMSEALRQEVGNQNVRVTIIEPGAVATELTDHLRPEIRDAVRDRFKDIKPLDSHDVADAITFAVTRPAHVSLNEILIRPTQQTR